MACSRSRLLPVLMLAAAGLAADDFALQLVDGSKLSARIKTPAFEIESSLGTQSIPLENIESVRFGDPDEVTTRKGTTLRGRVTTESVTIVSDIGEHTIARAKLLSLVREAAPEPAAPTQGAAPKSGAALPKFFGMFALQGSSYADCSKFPSEASSALTDFAVLPATTHFLFHDRSVALGAKSEAWLYPVRFVRYTIWRGYGAPKLKDLGVDDLKPNNRWRPMTDSDGIRLRGSPVEGNQHMVRLETEQPLAPGVYSMGAGHGFLRGPDFLFAVEPEKIDLYDHTVDAYTEDMMGMIAAYRPASLLDDARHVKRPAPKSVPAEGSERAAPALKVNLAHGALEKGKDGGTVTHPGVDLDGRLGDPVLSRGPGRVAEVIVKGHPYHNFLGNSVMVEDDQSLPGSKLYVIYLHMRDAPSVKAGDPLTVGAALGNVGDTGFATGPHLHLEVRSFRDWLLNDKGWMPIRDGKHTLNIYGRGDQRFTWRFYANRQDPLLFLEAVAAPANDAKEVERVGTAMSNDLTKSNELLAKLGKGGDDTAIWHEALPLYLRCLHLARLVEARHPKAANPKTIRAMTSAVCFNLACYWGAIHASAPEAAPWLEESVRLGLLEKKGLFAKTPKLSKFLEDASFDAIRGAPEIQALVSRHG